MGFHNFLLNAWGTVRFQNAELQVLIKDITGLAHTINATEAGTFQRFKATGFGTDPSTSLCSGVVATKALKRVPNVLLATRIRVHHVG